MTQAQVEQFKNVQALAKAFLKVADKNNDGVSAYLDGSLRTSDALAYSRTKEAYRAFVNALNAFYGERYDDSLDYDLAYSVL